MTGQKRSKTATRATPDGGPPYRLGVGLIVVNDKGETLGCERTNEHGQWQWPQGGLDEGEAALEAAYRELWEEVGLQADDVELIGKLPIETQYDFPDYLIARHKAEDGPSYVMKYRGQIHEWFVFRLTAPDARIHLDLHHEIEFCAWRWWPAEEIAAHIVEFKRDAYRSAAAALPALLRR